MPTGTAPYKYTGPGYNIQKLSPRVKMALRMYALGSCTLKRAAETMGLDSHYLTHVKNSQVGQAYMTEMSAALDEKSMETSALLEHLGREAVGRLAQLMRMSESENIVLRAAQDLADRGPATSKIQKHQVETFTLGNRDVQNLAEAMLASASMTESFPEAATGNFVKVPDALPRGDD